MKRESVAVKISFTVQEGLEGVQDVDDFGYFAVRFCFVGMISPI